MVDFAVDLHGHPGYKTVGKQQQSDIVGLKTSAISGNHAGDYVESNDENSPCLRLDPDNGFRFLVCRRPSAPGKGTGPERRA